MKKDTPCRRWAAVPLCAVALMWGAAVSAQDAPPAPPVTDPGLEVLSLPEIAVGVLRNWPALQRQRHELTAAGADADRVRALAYGPNLTATAIVGYEHRSYKDGPVTQRGYRRAEIGLDVTVPLYDFGASANRVKAAESKTKGSCHALDEATAGVLEDAVVAYGKILELRYIIQAIDGQMDVLVDLGRRMEELVKLQALAPTEVANHKARLSQLQLMRNNAETELTSREIQLSVFFGADLVRRPLIAPSKPVLPEGSFVDDKVAPALMTLALENAPGYQRALAEVGAAEAEKSAGEAAAFGKFTLQMGARAGSNVNGDQGTNRSMSGMVMYKVPLDFGGADSAARAVDSARLAAVKAGVSKSAAELEGQLRLVLYRLTQSESRLAQATALTEARASQLATTEQEVGFGSKSLSDWAGAVSGLVEARIERARAKMQNTEMAYRASRVLGGLYGSLFVQADLAQLYGKMARSTNFWEDVFFWQGLDAPDVQNCETPVPHVLDLIDPTEGFVVPAVAVSQRLATTP